VPHRGCICFAHCQRCSVELTCDVHYAVTPLTVTSRDLISNNPHVQPAHFLNDTKQDEAQDAGIAIVKLGKFGHVVIHDPLQQQTAATTTSHRGKLARIIVLDQFTRHLHRLAITTASRLGNHHDTTASPYRISDHSCWNSHHVKLSWCHSRVE
jgi:Bacterial protein of unknown function (DUF924)